MKKNIALVWGGYSSEKIVSAKSREGVYSFLDKERYNVYKTEISRNLWQVDIDGKNYPVDKNDFSFLHPETNRKVTFDFAYITIHGMPGEDGRLQGYFDMLGIPYSCCGVAAAALSFDKYRCNKFLKNFGIRVADSFHLNAGEAYDPVSITDQLGLPVFVKPSIGGSSFATNKVKTVEELDQAVQAALREAPEVIIESFIEGREVTCGCYKAKEKEVVLPITEIVTSNEFFDYEAKYQGQVEEITPANLPADLTELIGKLTLKIYGLLGAKGIARADFIIDKENRPWLLEVNTTPGMTLTSFIPQQVAAAGMDIKEVLSEIIENELSN